VGSDSDELRIDWAVEDDAPTLLRLIRELAEHEKIADQVVATEDDLRRTMFGEQKYAEALIARHDGEPVGFALFFHNYSTLLGKPGLYLEDLYVRPEARGKGVGLRLLTELARIARERDCGRMEWWVLDWNRPAIRFYEKLGAVPMSEWTVYRLTADRIADLAAKRDGGIGD